MTNCRCGQTVAAESSFCSRCGRRAGDGSLCRTLSECAERTFERLAAGYRIGMAPGEEAFTEFNLQDIHNAHGDRVSIRPFARHQEALNGADWEWWFFSEGVGFGMRVQAKRAKLKGGYDLRYRAGGRLQSDLLIEDAAASDCLPAYVFYNHHTWNPQQELPGTACAGCSHSTADQRQLGCTMVSALVVQRALLNPRVSMSYVRSRSRPWHHILCDEKQPGVPDISIPHQRIRELYWEATGDLEAALAEDQGPLTMRQYLRTGKIPSTASETPLTRRMPQRPSQRRPTAATPGEQSQPNLEGWTVYRKFEALAQRPAALPDRVHAMINNEELALPPDTRATGAILVNLGRSTPRLSSFTEQTWHAGDVGSEAGG